MITIECEGECGRTVRARNGTVAVQVPTRIAEQGDAAIERYVASILAELDTRAPTMPSSWSKPACLDLTIR